MERQFDIELTPEQKDVLASLAEETGESTVSLMDKVLDELQERLRAARETRQGQVGTDVAEPAGTSRKPIWAKIKDAFDRVPEEEIEELPTDGAANVDHYAYGLPKRS